MKQPDCIYFIRYKGEAFRHYVKIGLTSNFEQRLLHLQTSAPTGIETIATYSTLRGPMVERQLHKKLHRFRSNPDYEQSEWFYLEREDLTDALFLAEELIEAASKYKKEKDD